MTPHVKITAPILVAGLLGAAESSAAEMTDRDRFELHQAYAMLAVRVLEEEQSVVGVADHCAAKSAGSPSLQAAFAQWRQRNQVLYGRAHTILSPAFYDKVVGPAVASERGKAMRQATISLVPHYQGEARAQSTDPATLRATCVELEKKLGAGELDYRRQQPAAFRIVERIDLDNPLRYSQEQLVELAR